MSKHQYGLIKPKELKKATTSATFFQKKNIFDDDDSDDDGNGDPKKATDFKKAAMQAKMKRQTKLDLERAKEEDASVFQYDEVYDDMQEKKRSAAIAAKKSADRKPKYIANLMKHAEIRAREDERRTERKVQKEREAEGDEFRGKEVFVTSAYRKKMEEMQKEEEEEQRKERIEAMLDVTKQKDMSGFYRHIYRQTMGEEKGQKEEKGEEGDVKKEPQSDGEEDNKDEVRTEIKKLEKKERNFRKRDVKQEEEESEDESSSESGSSSEDDEKETVKEEVVKSREEKEAERRQKMREDKERRERRKRRIERGEESSSDEEEDEGKENKAKVAKKPGKDAAEGETAAADKPLPKKVKKDVWKKVTVEGVYAEAVAKYFRRKAERSGFPWEA